MTSECSIYGVGGIGVVFAEVAESNGLRVAAAFDDGAVGSTFRGVSVRGGFQSEDGFEDDLTSPIFTCLGNNSVRERIAGRLPDPGRWLAHETAHISPTASIGSGTMIFHGSYVQAGARLGRHVIVNTAASIDHDCEIGDFTHIAPQVALCGLVKVGRLSEIGAGAAVLPSVEIGENVHVGAGAVVLEDIPDNATAVGNPARVIKIDGQPV